MKSLIPKVLVLALLILGCVALAPRKAHASDAPLISSARLSMGVSGNYCFYEQAGDQKLPDFKKSWELGGLAAYNLVSQPNGGVPMLSATYSLNYDVDNKWWRHRLGLTLVLFKGVAK